MYNATVSPFAAAAGAIAAGSGAGGEDDIMCEELRPSEYTIRFRLAYVSRAVGDVIDLCHVDHGSWSKITIGAAQCGGAPIAKRRCALL